MEASDLLRHQIIESLMAQPTEQVADAAIELWEKLATEIISIVGEGGFTSLYARSVFLAQSTFPWLGASLLAPQADDRFAQLKISLAKQTPAHASEANRLLLITFTDILASLIGERLTASILRSAWGNDVSDSADKEFRNE
ncbi:MAG: hypothetical protein WBX11_16865 [Thiobacillaceae bacterium]